VLLTWNAGDKFERPQNPERTQSFHVERVDVNGGQYNTDHTARIHTYIIIIINTANAVDRFVQAPLG